MRTLPVATLALALSASTLMAQPDRNPRADGPRARVAQGPRVGGSPAEALLRQRARLELTTEQVTRLEALAQSQRAARTVSPGTALRLRADLMDAMAGDGNVEAARAALDKLSASRNERLIAGMRAQQEVRAVLTPEQRARVEAARGMRNRVAMHGGARRGPGEARGVRGPQGRGGAVQPGRAPGGNRGSMPDRRPARPDGALNGN
jgi:Spy/CpxP family protein refolding chaperone